MTSCEVEVSKIEDQARYYCLALQDRGYDDGLRDEFGLWIEEDLAHQKAFDEQLEFMAFLESVSSENCETLDMELSVQDDKKNVTEFPGNIRKRRQGFLYRAMQVAAVLFVGFFSYNQFDNYLPEGSYRTAIGEQKTIVLSDGTTVSLNTDTYITVDFSGEVRRILFKRGEALFNVAKDKSKPFIVQTSYGSVRAVGTEFNVFDSGENKVEIIVVEGTVSVKEGYSNLESVDYGLGAGTYVNAGFKVSVVSNKIGTVNKITTGEIFKETAWRAGKIIFTGEPLEEVVDRMARYTGRKIFIPDDKIAKYKLGGAFDINDFDSFVNAVEETFPVKVIRVTPFAAIIVNI